MYTYWHTLSLHDALPIWYYAPAMARDEVLLIKGWDSLDDGRARFTPHRSEEHTAELQSLMRSSYAVCWLKKNSELKDRLAPSLPGAVCAGHDLVTAGAEPLTSPQDMCVHTAWQTQ